MKYLKINDFWNQFSQPDYKGLDISKFIAGSQLCPEGATYCVIATNEELATLPTDVVEITETEYTSEKTAIETKSKQKIQAITDRVSSVEVAIANLMGV